MRSIKRTEYIYHIKSLLLLGLPIIIGQLGNIITGLADTVMVGQHSTEELAAASFVNNVINAFIILGTGFSFNYTPIIGENIAVNKRIAIGGWLKNSLIANFTTTISILIVLLLIYDYHLIIDSRLTGDLPKPRLFRPTRRTLAIDKTLFRSLISLDPIRNAL